MPTSGNRRTGHRNLENWKKKASTAKNFMWLSTWWYNVAQQDKNHSPCTTDLIVSQGGRLLSVEAFHENQEGNEGKWFCFLRLTVIH